MEMMYGLKLVQYDINNDEHRLDNHGKHMLCSVGQVGELLVAIQTRPGRTFSGYYKNPKATERKILRNVFKKDDMYMRTGDLLKRDADRRWYFVDRIGDTFRWKGENVSTSLVASVLHLFPGILEVNVYGVVIPGQEDGRACMAALCFTPDTFAWQDFIEFVEKELPVFSRPIFLRQRQCMERTGTFKQQKTKLRQEGMNPEKVADCMWYFDSKQRTYCRLTNDSYPQVLKIKF